jgi:hypothetical protein
MTGASFGLIVLAVKDYLSDAFALLFPGCKIRSTALSVRATESLTGGLGVLLGSAERGRAEKGCQIGH